MFALLFRLACFKVQMSVSVQNGRKFVTVPKHSHRMEGSLSPCRSILTEWKEVCHRAEAFSQKGKEVCHSVEAISQKGSSSLC